MKAGWYENKLKLRWRAYQIENLNNQLKTLSLKNSTVIDEIVKINDEIWNSLEATSETVRFDDIPWINKNIITRLHINKDIRKKLLLRWHPDRFFTSKIWERIHEDDKEKVKMHVNELCEIITSSGE